MYSAWPTLQHGDFSHLLAGDEITTRGKVVQPLQSVKFYISAVLTVMRDLDPHMISWWWNGYDMARSLVIVMVLVQGVLDGCGFSYSTGSTRWL